MLASALAATAFAKPMEKRQVVVTTVDVVYTTDIVTVTAGQSSSAATTSAAPAKSSGKHGKHGHHHPSSYPASSSYQPVPSSYQPPQSSSSSAPAPVPTTSDVPAPAPTSYSSAAPAPAPSSSSSAAAAPQPTSYGGTATTFQQAVVDHHNYHRANHSAPNIAWDQTLADTAMTIAKTCVYAHSMNVNGGGYGQNIAAGEGASDISTTISDLFYNGEVNKFTQYGEANPDMSTFESWGHFSQIVWKDSTKVGCATWKCSSGLTNFDSPSNPYFTVCNYSPPGNFGGEYGANIGASLNQATVPGSANVDTAAIGKSYCGATGQDVN